ncbi:MAG: hypothetical protein ACOX6E_07330, partial [Syntrophomonadaceae bacterium]
RTRAKASSFESFFGMVALLPYLDSTITVLSLCGYQYKAFQVRISNLSRRVIYPAYRLAFCHFGYNNILTLMYLGFS